MQTLRYCRSRKICGDTIICAITMPNKIFLPGKYRRPKALPVTIAITTIQTIRHNIINSVLIYGSRKFRLLLLRAHIVNQRIHCIRVFPCGRSRPAKAVVDRNPLTDIAPTAAIGIMIRDAEKPQFQPYSFSTVPHREPIRRIAVTLEVGISILPGADIIDCAGIQSRTILPHISIASMVLRASSRVYP